MYYVSYSVPPREAQIPRYSRTFYDIVSVRFDSATDARSFLKEVKTFDAQAQRPSMGRRPRLGLTHTRVIDYKTRESSYLDSCGRDR